MGSGSNATSLVLDAWLGLPEFARMLPSGGCLVDFHREGNLLSVVLQCCFSQASMRQGSLQCHRMSPNVVVTIVLSTYMGQGFPRAP